MYAADTETSGGSEMYNTIQISERIRAMRDLCGISVDEMAEATGVSPEEYIKCETGQIDFPFTFIYKCKVQLGNEITVTVSLESSLSGLFGGIFPLDLTSKASGLSNVYWK